MNVNNKRPRPTEQESKIVLVKYNTFIWSTTDQDLDEYHEVCVQANDKQENGKIFAASWKMLVRDHEDFCDQFVDFLTAYLFVQHKDQSAMTEEERLTASNEDDYYHAADYVNMTKSEWLAQDRLPEDLCVHLAMQTTLPWSSCKDFASVQDEEETNTEGEEKESKTQRIMREFNEGKYRVRLFIKDTYIYKRINAEDIIVIDDE